MSASTPQPPAPSNAPAPSRAGHWLRAVAAVAGLWAFVVALPVLDVLRGAPEFFVAHRADTGDLLAIAAIVVAAVPLAAAVLLAAAGAAGPRAINALAGLCVALLIAVEAAILGYRAGLTSWSATLALAAAAFALGSVAWWRWRPMRHLFAALAVALLLVPAVFLSSSGIRGLLRANPTQVGARQSSQLPPVVVIVFDELPVVSLMGEDGRIDAVRYPHFAALAADGVWFRNATTVSDFTRWALPAILTGRYPRAGSVPTPADHPDSLFTRLAATHRMEVTEPLTALCPPELNGKPGRPRADRLRRMLADVRVVAASVFLPPAARAGLPDFTEGWADFADQDDSFRQAWRAGERLDPLAIAAEFVDGIAATDEQPTLYFLHTLVSHHPPRWLPSGQGIANFKTPPGMTRALRWKSVSWPVTLFEQGALVQAGAADTVLGRLRARLAATGLYDRALVVVTADHGITFTPEAPMRGFSEAGAGGIVPVPLIVKLPADRQVLARGTIDDRNVETIDILPTIADAIGLVDARPLDGASALRDRVARAVKQVHFDQARRVRAFEPAEIARLRDAAVRSKVATFGSGPWPSPAPPGLASLVGRPLESLAIARTGGPRLQVDHAFALDQVDLGAPVLPVQVKGRVLGLTPAASASVFLAVALNGTVAAATRTWEAEGRWMALLPPALLRSGSNDLRVFTVDPARPTTLVPATVSTSLPPGLNLLSPTAAEYGVSHGGFHHAEMDGATPFHWTKGDAALTVPIDRARVPSRLELEILSAGRTGKPLRVLVDDCEVVSERLPEGRWSRTLTLGACAPRGEWTTIRLVTETHRPGDRDRRRLGVALSRVVLRD